MRSMIQLSQDEVVAFNILAVKAQETQEMLNGAVAAQQAFISLCELKYNAVYDKETGKFNPKG
jgi:hypothetical protein